MSLLTSSARATSCRVVTVSDRCVSGEREDRSGPRLVELLTEAGYAVHGPVLIPDGVDSVAGALRDAVADGARLVVTTGGTGVGPRDLTPEGTRRVITRELVGVAEHLRREGLRYTRTAVLSRAVVGVVDPGDEEPGGALVANLPGSVRAVEQNLDALLPLVPHLIAQLDAGDHG